MLFRIVLAAISLFDLVTHTAYLSAHYTDQGILPRTFLIRDMHPWELSVNMMSGSGSVQALIFAVGALAALGMLVGFRTRLSTVILWVIVMSIQWRNPFVLNAGATPVSASSRQIRRTGSAIAGSRNSSTANGIARPLPSIAPRRDSVATTPWFAENCISRRT